MGDIVFDFIGVVGALLVLGAVVYGFRKYRR
jgi:hypothetical protein